MALKRLKGFSGLMGTRRDCRSQCDSQVNEALPHFYNMHTMYREKDRKFHDLKPSISLFMHSVGPWNPGFKKPVTGG